MNVNRIRTGGSSRIVCRGTMSDSANQDISRLAVDMFRNYRFWALATILTGLTGICGWIGESRVLATIIPHSIAMAPASAFLFVLIGLIILILGIQNIREQYGDVLNILLLLPFITGLWFVFDTVSHYSQNIDWTVYSTEQLFWIVPESLMSPISAVLFPGLAIGMYLTTHRYSSGSLIALLIACTGALFMFGYLIGIPFFYHTAIKPISFLSSCGFFFSGIGVRISAKP